MGACRPEGMRTVEARGEQKQGGVVWREGAMKWQVRVVEGVGVAEAAWNTEEVPLLRHQPVSVLRELLVESGKYERPIVRTVCRAVVGERTVRVPVDTSPSVHRPLFSSRASPWRYRRQVVVQCGGKGWRVR